MNKETELKPAKWRRLRTVPGVIGMTILTTLVGAGITWLVGDLKEANFRPSDAIKLSVETDPAKMSETNSNARYWSAVIPSTVRTHGSPFKDGGCRGFHSWVADNHGTDAGTSILQISAQGATDKAVLIQNMRVSIIQTSPPLTGLGVECPTAGNAQLRQIAVNLDATPPTVDYKSDSNAPFGFTLAKGETESFVVSASAAKATYRWRIEFVWSSTGWRIPWKSAERMDSQQPWPRTRLGNGIT
ncbi:MAG TPA: hypothetical protein VKG83_10420 [Mycobacterium sp.]|nr:hypothetical protein [Mycobacterium sp.]